MITYGVEHPDTYQKEIVEEFGCNTVAIYLTMKCLKNTQEKTMRYREQIEGTGGRERSGRHIRWRLEAIL